LQDNPLEDLFTGNQNTESFSKRPVRRRSHRPIIIYAGEYGGKKMRLNMKCNNTILLFDEQHTSTPPKKTDLNLSLLKQLQI
jgi:hypothetical protein